MLRLRIHFELLLFVIADVIVVILIICKIECGCPPPLGYM